MINRLVVEESELNTLKTAYKTLSQITMTECF